MPKPLAQYLEERAGKRQKVEHGTSEPNHGLGNPLNLFGVYRAFKDTWTWTPHVLLILAFTISSNPLETAATELCQSSPNRRIGEMRSKGTVPTV